MKTAQKIWYFDIEPLAARYTAQLCREWMPDAFEQVGFLGGAFEVIRGDSTDTEIQVGAVLDATGRGQYCSDQVYTFLTRIREGQVSSGDAIFLQDFWTPGFEAVLYALHLHGLRPRIYATVWAQSVDEYDFTWGMRQWMRPMELGLSRALAGVFVGSTVHRDQLRAAGFECPIHVVGLTISAKHVRAQMPKFRGHRRDGRHQVIFTSRLDREKNPWFMLKVAQAFLERRKDYVWVCTTSAAHFRSNDPGALQAAIALAHAEPRFEMKAGLSKEEYYSQLAQSDIQFNCSLQDYVSWTLLESQMADCVPVYPNFRSFPEILPARCMYEAFSVGSALQVLDTSILELRLQSGIVEACDRGRLAQAEIIAGIRPDEPEINIWHNNVQALSLK
jgi:hypothetical protein